MAQNTVDYSDNPTGPELLDNYLNKEQENLLSCNSGVQRPSYAAQGTLWLDVSVTPWVLKMYDGSEDVTIGTVNSTTHNFLADSVDESNLVHKSETETISGAKTFTGSNTFNSSPLVKANFSIQSTAINKGTPPTDSPIYQILAFHDKNGTTQGSKTAQIYTEYTTGGLMSFNMQVFKPLSGNTTTEKIAIYYPASGSPYTYAPTPTTLSNTSSNNGQIVNVGYLDSVSVKLTGNQTIAGTKTFSTSPVVPTPGVSSNTTVPATTAYVNTKFQKVNSLPSSPNSNTFYFIPE